MTLKQFKDYTIPIYPQSQSIHNPTLLSYLCILFSCNQVIITIKHHQLTQYGDRARCVFWDFDQLMWSTDGCHVIEHLSSRSQTTCECDHLTNFAVLFDISNRENNNSRLKHLLSVICCAISSVALGITVVLQFCIQTMRNRRGIITGNLSACLLAVNLLVIFGLDRTENEVTCRILSGALLYAILAAFSWMLMEGYFLYQMVILVFKYVETVADDFVTLSSRVIS